MRLFSSLIFIAILNLTSVLTQANAETLDEMTVFIIKDEQGDQVENVLKTVPLFGKVLGEIEVGRTLAIHHTDGKSIVYYRGKNFVFGQNTDIFKFSIEANDYELRISESKLLKSSQNSKSREMYLGKVYQSQNKNMLNELERLEKIVEKKTLELDDLKKLNEALSAKDEKNEASADMKITILNEQIKSLIFENTEHQKKRSLLETSLSDKETLISELESELQKIKNELDEQNKKTSLLKNELANNEKEKEKIAFLQNELRKINKQVLDLKEQNKSINELKQTNQALRNQMDEANYKLQQADKFISQALNAKNIEPENMKVIDSEQESEKVNEGNQLTSVIADNSTPKSFKTLELPEFGKIYNKCIELDEQSCNRLNTSITELLENNVERTSKECASSLLKVQIAFYELKVGQTDDLKQELFEEVAGNCWR